MLSFLSDWVFDFLPWRVQLACLLVVLVGIGIVVAYVVLS